ncbi:MAG: SMC-Scp complex subunit ScpB [Chitinophagaceae bacterium]|nr:SMC-Scp complex subunit ScpB [Chitinophagaceae bacterium]
MELSEIIPHIEALIFASEKPLTSLEITELINNAFGFMEDKITLDQIEAAVEGIIEKYGSDFYPFEVRESGGGWQFLTKKDYHKTVAQLNGDKYLKRLSSASLETLSIIAYKQPVTKGEIEAIRGVSSDYSIQKLLEKELILITGRNEDMPGKPLVYVTSRNFMDYFGLNSPDDLPRIKEVLADQVVVPTPVTDNEIQPDTFPDAPQEQAGVLLVTGNGELLEQAGIDIKINTNETPVEDAGFPGASADAEPGTPEHSTPEDDTEEDDTGEDEEGSSDRN